MMTKGKFQFLGTGGSMGIPVIGCNCKVCKSESPCNNRMRPSGLITIGKKRLLIDAGPDFRFQALKYHIDHLDGVLMTHAHHDHIAGIDELRVYYMRSKYPLPFLLSEETAIDLKRRYDYIFNDSSITEKLVPRLTLQTLTGTHGEVHFLDTKIGYISYEQAGMRVTGFRFGDFAYVSDISHYPESIFSHLEGIKTLVLSALRHEKSHFHLSVDEAVGFANRVGAHTTWLTHISHDLDHEETNTYLPPHVRMSYDGLELHFNIDN